MPILLARTDHWEIPASYCRPQLLSAVQLFCRAMRRVILLQTTSQQLATKTRSSIMPVAGSFLGLKRTWSNWCQIVAIWMWLQHVLSVTMGFKVYFACTIPFLLHLAGLDYLRLALRSQIFPLGQHRLRFLLEISFPIHASLTTKVPVTGFVLENSA